MAKKRQPPAAAPGLRLEWRSPTELAANPRNWRRHPEAQQAALAGVLSEVGWAGACLFNETTGLLIDGHLRQKVALANGADKIPVLVGAWTPEQEAKILATLDPLAGMADADPVALDALLREVNTGCEELQQMLADLWDENKPPDEPAAPVDEDTPPEPQAAVVTRPGDLWTIGPHRLLCGDCREPAAWERLLGGELIGAVLTDPPYGINQEGVPNDEPEKLGGIISGAVNAMPLTNGVCVSFGSTRTFPAWLDAIRKAGHQFERMLWLYKKAQCSYPWRGWLLKSEAILVSTIGEPRWNDAKPYSHDCYELPEVSGELPDGIGWHGSVKPVAVVADIVQRICQNGDVVADPFVGSGTTIMACEHLGRRCFACEIEPAYVDVCLRRYVAKYPDADPVRHDGTKWSELTA